MDAWVISHIGFCKILLDGVSVVVSEKLQRVQNACSHIINASVVLHLYLHNAQYAVYSLLISYFLNSPLPTQKSSNNLFLVQLQEQGTNSPLHCYNLFWHSMIIVNYSYIHFNLFVILINTLLFLYNVYFFLCIYIYIYIYFFFFKRTKLF